MRPADERPDVGPRRALVVADLGGTNLRTALVALDSGDLLARDTGRTPADDPHRAIESIRAAAAASPLPVVGGVIGVPGPVSYREGAVRMLPNLPLWRDSLTEALLTDRLGVPTVLANDADLAALGEHQIGAGRGVEDMVYLTISTGVGGGAILGGRLAHGARSIAEVGWMPSGMYVNTSVEEVASGSAMRRRTGWSGEELLRRAGAGEPAALEALQDAAEAIGVAVATVAALFAPQRIVIGGGFGLAAFDRLVGPARARLDRLSWMGAPPELRRAELGDDAGLRGGLPFWESRMDA